MFTRRLVYWPVFVPLFFMLPVSWASNSEYAPSSFYRNVYVDVNVGYAVVNWDQFSPAQSFIINRNARGGFSFGADTGYQYNRNFGFELGWYYLPEVKYTTPADVRFTVQSWLAYSGVKVWLPIYNRLYLFGKFAASYRYLDFTSSPSGVLPDGRHPLWRPVAAIGWQYNMTSAWSLSMQYLYVYGRNNNALGAVIAPDINLITLAYTYKFAV